MFTHKGKTRTLKHNLNIASLLSFVAGIVNVAGFLSVQRMTTNVTEHFDFLLKKSSNSISGRDLYIFYIFSSSFGVPSCQILLLKLLEKETIY